MIPQVDEVLRSLLGTAGAPCRLGVPGDDWDGRPTISLLLHGLTEDLDARYASWRERRNGAGTVTGRQKPPRRYWFAYLVTAWASDPGVEHALAGAVLEILSDLETVPDEHLGEALRETGETVQISTGHPDSIGSVPLWHALGIGPRVMLSVQVAASMPHRVTAVPAAPREIDLGVGGGLAPVPPARPTAPRPTRRISEGSR